MDNIEFLKAVAIRIPAISLANALGLLEDAERFIGTPVPLDLSKHENLVAFARTLPEVKQHLRDGKKIQAVKVLRTAGRAASGEARNADGYPVVGLKQAKDVVDALAKESEYAFVPPTYSCGTCGHSSFHYSDCINYFS